MTSVVKRISEGAMMCAITAVLLLLNRQSGGLIELAFQWLLALPILLYTARYGARAALLPAVCMLLLAFFLSAFSTLFYMSVSILLGLFYGHGVRRGWRNGVLLSVVFIVTLLSNVLTMLVFAAFFGYDPIADIDLAKQVLGRLQMEEGHLLQAAVAIVLFSVFFFAFLQTLCTHLIAALTLKRLRIKARPLQNFFQIPAPRWLGLALLTIWLLYLLQNVIELYIEFSVYTGSLFRLLLLLSLLAAILYGMLTAMCACVLYERRKLVVLLYALLVIPIVNLSFALLGMADLLFQVRQRMIRGVENGTSGKF